MGKPPWKNVNLSISCCSSLVRRFFVLECRKRHSPALYCLKIILEKWPFLDQNHGLIALEKCQFFDFLNVLFLYSRKTFFVLEYRKRHIPGPYHLRKKVPKMAIFGPIPWANPFPKTSVFRI